MAKTIRLLSEDSEKKYYSTDEPDVIAVRFTDTTVAYGGVKKADFKGKGIACAKTSALAFRYLEAAGIGTWFRQEGEESGVLLCSQVELLPLQFVVRNRLFGTTARLLALEEGFRPESPVTEIRYARPELEYPMINSDHAVALGVVSREELDGIGDIVRKVNVLMTELYRKAGIELADIKLRIGRTADGRFVVADEISPETCRLRDLRDGRILDKDRFRHDLSDVCVTYREVKERLEGLGI